MRDKHYLYFFALATAAGFFLAPCAANAQAGSAFTYQGHLADAGGPVTATCDFDFSLWDAQTGGSQIGATVSQSLAVSGGLFTADLDFGAAAFDGNGRWLEVVVDCGAGPATLPRQELTPSPYSLRALAVDWDAVQNIPAGFADGVDDDTLEGLLCANGQIAIRSGGAWICGADANSGGDITSVTAGTGLTGGGAAGDVAVAASFGGSGGATTVSRSDHDHYGDVWSGATSPGLQINHNNTVNSGILVSTQGTDFDAEAIQVQVTDASSESVGVTAFTLGDNGNTAGLYAQTLTAGGAKAVWGQAGPVGTIGIYGNGGSSGMAGIFAGDVGVTGMLSKGGGSFKIDHPLDPENKYLYHSFVESPDMMNVYNGNVTLDARGEAVVALPDWFEALNRDFRYQLTAIGAPAPDLYVAGEIAGNRFRIAGGAPGTRVSWQVTGIREDPFANANRIPVEELKAKEEAGTYLHPDAYGLAPEMGAPLNRSVDRTPDADR